MNNRLIKVKEGNIYDVYDIVYKRVCKSTEQKAHERKQLTSDEEAETIKKYTCTKQNKKKVFSFHKHNNSTNPYYDFFIKIQYMQHIGR